MLWRSWQQGEYHVEALSVQLSAVSAQRSAQGQELKADS
jgi:hypothetical protein